MMQNRSHNYLWISLAHITLAILLAMQISCSHLIAPPDGFNTVHRRYMETTEPVRGVVIDRTVTVRVRIFSDEADKQAAFARDWPQFGKCPYGATVSSAVNEIWLSARRDRSGKLEINPSVNGHEWGHILNINLAEFINPDAKQY
jgi:hypothetical protein